MLSTSPAPLTSPVLHLSSAVFESFLGRGCHWLHSLCASAKQGEMLQRISLLQSSAQKEISSACLDKVSAAQKSPWSFDFCPVYFARAGMSAGYVFLGIFL